MTGHGAVPIACTPDDLTPAWLTTALRSSSVLGRGRVTDVTLELIGTGQMCDCVRVRLRYDQATDAPDTIVAKLPAADPTSRATATSTHSYENEVRFYQQLAPELPIRTPEAYYADVDEESSDFVLLLEDLAPARQGDQLAGCSPEQARIAVGELVKLHAPRWGDVALSKLEWLHRDKEAQRAALSVVLPVLWAGFRDRYGADLDAEVIEAGTILFAHIDDYLLADAGVFTVVHGDYRLDNVLFDPEPDADRVAVVDWQMVSDGPAMSDVAYFIGAGLRLEDRRGAESELVRHYHDALSAAGVAGYSFDRCWRDYRKGTWSGLVMAVAASLLVERTARGDQMFLTMAGRHARHALDLDAAETIGA